MTMTDELLADGRAADEKARADRRWQLDRKITLGLLVGSALYVGGAAAGGIWFAAHLDARLATVETWVHENAGTEHRLTLVEGALHSLIEQRRAER